MSRMAALADKALDGTLEQRLRSWRKAGLSYDAIAQRLQDLGVQVGREGARAWCFELGIENGAGS